MFWNKKWGKEELCPITYTRLKCGYNKHGYPNTCVLNCKHRYNFVGICKWLAKGNLLCPLCKTSVESIQGNCKNTKDFKIIFA